MGDKRVVRMLRRCVDNGMIGFVLKGITSK